MHEIKGQFEGSAISNIGTQRTLRDGNVLSARLGHERKMMKLSSSGLRE